MSHIRSRLGAYKWDSSNHIFGQKAPGSEIDFSNNIIQGVQKLHHGLNGFGWRCSPDILLAGIDEQFLVIWLLAAWQKSASLSTIMRMRSAGAVSIAPAYSASRIMTADGATMGHIGLWNVQLLTAIERHVSQNYYRSA